MFFQRIKFKLTPNIIFLLYLGLFITKKLIYFTLILFLMNTKIVIYFG